MNNEIRRRRSQVLFTTFKNYLVFIGFSLKEDADIFLLLETPPTNANSFNSKRFIQKKVLSREELKILYDSSTEEQKFMYSFFYDTACRRSELLKVRHKDIVLMDKEKNKKDIENGIYAQVLLHGKGQKNREVYLTKTTVDLYNKVHLDRKKDDKVFVFYKENGQKYKSQSQTLYYKVTSFTKSVLGRRYHPHCFRHTRLTHLADSGADILGIKGYAGHEDVSTSQIYIEISSFIGKRVFADYGRPIVE